MTDFLILSLDIILILNTKLFIFCIKLYQISFINAKKDFFFNGFQVL